MTNKPHRRPRRRPTEADLEAAVVASIRASGCNCQPSLNITVDANGTCRADIGHDSWCRLWMSKGAAWN